MSKEETRFINEKIAQKRQLKNIVLTIFLTALIVGVPTFLVSKTVFASLAGATTEAIWEAGTQVSESSYVIWKEDSTYYAKNGTTGQVEYSGTNATQVITNAIRANSKLYLKAGTYTITSTIRKSVHNVVITGEGRGTIIKVQDSTQINAINLTNVRNWIIRDLAIDGNKDNQVDAGAFDNQNGIFLGESGGSPTAHAHNITLENLWIHNCTTSGICGRSTGLIGITITQCRIWNCHDDGITIRLAKDITITNNHVWNIGNGDRKDHGIYCYGGEDRGAIIIQGNTIENIVHGDGIEVYTSNGNNATVSDNIIKKVGRIGIYVTSILGDNSHNIVDSNQIYNPGQNASEAWREGIKIAGWYSVVSNNIVVASPTVGIYVTVAKFSTVSGNLVKNGTGSSGIKIHESSHSSATGNIIIGEDGTGLAIDTSNYTSITGNTASYNQRGINIDAAYHLVISGNSACNNDNYGIIEWANADYNNIVGCSCWNNPTNNIQIIGANTEVHSCFNGTTYIT